jgi:hypothetical protein
MNNIVVLTGRNKHLEMVATQRRGHG